MSQRNSKEYNLSVHTNNVHSAIAQTATALYEMVEEALQAHEDHEAEECEFEAFARDVLAVLQRHADQIAEPETALTDGSDDGDLDELNAD